MLSRKKLRDEIIEIIESTTIKPVRVYSELYYDLGIDKIHVFDLMDLLEYEYEIFLYENWLTVQDVIDEVGNALIEQGYKFDEAEEEV